jgi:hypothetical protein
MYKKTKKNKKTNLKNKSNRTKIINTQKKYLTKRGGWALGEESLRLFPRASTLAQFKISESNLLSFQRTFNSPMDCFINALQLAGMIDLKCANLLRISTKGQAGFSDEEIELISMYVTNHNYAYRSVDDYTVFSELIKQTLKPGHVVFAGYTGHIFLIGRHIDGKIVYIDPQVPNTPCYLADPQCEGLIRNGQNVWGLLFKSSVELTPAQQQLVIDYISRPLEPPPLIIQPNNIDDDDSDL